MKILKWILAALTLLLILVLAGYGFASYSAAQKLSRQVEVSDVDIPVPWPLTEEEIETLRQELQAQASVDEEPPNPSDPIDSIDLEAIAAERAIERGRHLLTARYPCTDCHGQNFGGGVMVDDPAIGTILGPNLTTGEGSVVKDYTASDWHRIIRHGVTPEGFPTVMPSIDFIAMSDQEVSDIIVYIQSLPPVDNEVPPLKIGPLGKVLLATNNIILTADIIDHSITHRRLPPTAAPTEEFGEHLSQVCAGCHGVDFRGGTVPGSPPDWPPATNLTSHPEGLGDWTFEEFEALMREGRSRDGSQVRDPMYEISQFGKNMTDVELEAIFLFLSNLPPRPTP